MRVFKNRPVWLSFLLPGLLAYLLTVFFPIVQSMYYSLINWNGVQQQVFVGLDNYKAMVADSIFWKAFGNNMLFIVYVVAIQVVFGLLLAVMLTCFTRGTNLVRTLYYIPAIITTVGIAQLFRFIYSKEPLGLLNALLQFIGLDGITQSWLSNPKTALACLAIAEGWRFIGMYVIIFYAGLQSIDDQVLESARIDGANEWQAFWRIRMPLLAPVTRLALILSLTSALKGFDIPYLINGPAYSTELVTTYMYQKAFMATRFGYASAIACFVVLEAVVAVLLVNLLFSLGREREE